jgi:glutamate-ammonia-ligase adenylyltransferase
MTNRSAFAAEVRGCLERCDVEEADRCLESFLASGGYLTPSRSVDNLRLLAEFCSPALLGEIASDARFAPSPDQALNGLERVSTAVLRDDLLAVCGDTGRLSDLLTICGSSPFLVSILRRYPEYFHNLFLENGIAEARSLTETLELLRGMVDGETDFKTLLPVLRRFKYREILRIAARDLNGLASLEEVTEELSDLASVCLQVAYEVCRRLLVREHGAPMMRTPEGEREADLVVLGMGKLGGRELNFSSDIDLIYFYSSDNGETAGVSAPDGSLKGRQSLHAFFIKLAEMITKAVSQVTEDGFVFRTDLGLRPEGKSGDLALSLRSAEVYYESWGQPWERSAMLKARPVAGSPELGERFLRMIEPFVYRKYLDYTLIEDMMAMKKRIDLSIARDRGGEDNIKLGRGGIREIEFFIQATQLVFAGKNPALRARNSFQALRILRDADIITPDDCEALSDAYRFLRTVEHRIQVVQERQTHSLPSGEDEMRYLARRCGYVDEDGPRMFRETLESHRAKVSSMYGDLFLSREKRKEEVAPETYLIFDPNADSDLVKDLLAERRFDDVDTAYDNLIHLRDGTPRSHLPPKGRRLREEITPLLFQEIIASPDPDMALSNLEKFFRAVGPRTSFYALLAENREILKLLVSLFGMSEFLSKIFILSPEILDTMVSRSFSPVKGFQEAQTELASLLEQADDFEDRLDILRRYRHEEFLRIGIHDIYGRLDQAGIAGQLTTLAEVCLSAAREIAEQELSRFGTPLCVDEKGEERPARFAVISMGKLGGRELNYHSDLDIIYVYDYQGMTNGNRQISNREYFAKLGQKVISILSTPTREGYVYTIDTRLRPSGNAGPLVTSLESFRAYHREEAHVWERQALTKARVVVGEGRLREEIEEVIRDTVYGAGADDEVRREIHRLRMRMEHELARESMGSYNIKTGRGGMVDVEFIVQYLQLRHGRDFPRVRSVSTLEALQALHACSLVSDEDFHALFDGYAFLRNLENRLRIIHDYSMNQLGGPKGYLNKLARRLGYDERLRHPGEALIADYERITGAVRQVYERILGVGEAPASI